MKVDHPDLNFQNGDASKNSYGTGSPTLSPKHITNANVGLSYFGSTNINMRTGGNMQRASDLLITVSMYDEPTRTKVIHLAHSAMEELLKIGAIGKPLWKTPNDNKYETLNDIEYLRRFGQVDEMLRENVKLVEVGEPKRLPSFDSYQAEHSKTRATRRAYLQIEASRDMTYIKMSPINLVELLIDMKQWTGAFHNLVSRATILGTLEDGVEGSYDGKLHVISAEFHLPTSLVPTWECYFARYCKQLSNEMWGVVDVSLEKIFPSPLSNFKRRPSGCLIMGMPEGCSKVIWIEHVEADHSQLSNHYQQLVTSGLAFGATRWLASMVRHNEWCETMKETQIPLVTEYGVFIPQVGRRSLLNLADRMIRIFCIDTNASRGNPWLQIASYPGTTDVRVMIKNHIDDPLMPPGTTMVFTTSIVVKVSPTRLFNFLRHESSRNKWDLLSRKVSIREFAYMMKGKNPGNRVSLLQANTSEGKLQIFYIQESYTDSIGSYVIYAPIDEFAMSALASGGNPDKVIILPSGFAILPEGLPRYDNGKDSGTGSLLTITFRVFESATARSFIPPGSVETIHRIITDTITCINDAVL